MIRSELIERVAGDNPGLMPKEVERLVGAVFDAISNHLIEGGRVELRGFGSFSTRARDPRTGRNPRTGIAVDVAAKRVLHFEPGKEMRASVDFASVPQPA